jgi:hypothetical protein
MVGDRALNFAESLRRHSLTIKRYASAVAIAAFAIGLRLLLDPWLGRTGFAISLTGMLVAAWVGGLGPCLICQTVILLADA